MSRIFRRGRDGIARIGRPIPPTCSECGYLLGLTKNGVGCPSCERKKREQTMTGILIQHIPSALEQDLNGRFCDSSGRLVIDARFPAIPEEEFQAIQDMILPTAAVRSYEVWIQAVSSLVEAYRRGRESTK